MEMVGNFVQLKSGNLIMLHLLISETERIGYHSKTAIKCS